MSSLQYLEVVFCFVSLTELTRFSIFSFVLWSFQVLGSVLMDYGTRSGKSLSLGMPMAPQYNLRRPKSQSLGMPRKASPLSSTSIGNLLGAMFLFTTWYVFCLEHLVLFEYLFFSLTQSYLMYTPFDERHTWLRID